MFGRKRKDKYRRRGSNPIFGLFRLLLSLTIFAVLLGGGYSAYKQFSGVDPIKINPQSAISNFISTDKAFSIIYGLLSLDFKPKEIINNQKIIPKDNQAKTNQVSTSGAKSADVAFKFAILADSHNENDFLGKALDQAKSANVKFIIGLGDYTDVGTLSELQNAKNEFDKTGIRYFVTAGDHDLWDSRNQQGPALENFNKVFGQSYQSFAYDQVRFLILDNSDNYLGWGDQQLNWLSSEIERIKKEQPMLILAFFHEPLFHPSSTRIMGKTIPTLREEARKITLRLRDLGVKETFSGDVHYFTRYHDSESGLAMTTLGAVASLRNAQLPRFVIVSVYDDGTYQVEDVEIR